MIKENLSSKGFVVDKDDYSVIRSEPLFKRLFEKVKLQVIYESK